MLVAVNQVQRYNRREDARHTLSSIDILTPFDPPCHFDQTWASERVPFDIAPYLFDARRHEDEVDGAESELSDDNECIDDESKRVP